MSSDEVLAAFARQHVLDIGSLFTEERDAVRCSVECHRAIDEGYRLLPASVLESDLAVGFVWQLYHRCAERTFGALAAFGTSCVASSEIVARATIEATLTVRYILRDANPRLASFFQNHIDQAERQADQWRKATESLHGTERRVHRAAVAQRADAIAAMKTHVDNLTAQLVPVGSIPPWPTVAARFESIGEGLHYRTFYARLCGEPHFDAEEALRFFLGTVIGDGLRDRLAVETVMFSRFLLAEAVRTYAVAGAEFAARYGMRSAHAKCLSSQRILRGHVLSLSNHIGARPVVPRPAD